jgi:hypothetical protein
MRKMNFTLMLLSCLLSANLFGQNVPSYVPTSGLVGWWPFNGNANDESGNGNNGTVNGATLTSDRFGNVNAAYSFTSVVSNFISADIGLLNNSISISGWYEAPSPTTRYPRIYYYGDYPFNFSNNQFNTITAGIMGNEPSWIGTYTGRFYCETNISNSGFNHPSITSNNQWHFFTIVNDIQSNTTSMYIDGQFINSNVLGQNSISSSLIYFGRDPGDFFGGCSGCGRFNGKLDDIGIWNRALDSAEVAALYNGNICYQTITVTDTLLINTNITSYNPVTYENTIKIWPNPAKTHITIDAGDLNVMNGYSLRIVNAFGQQVFQSAISQQQYYLDLSTWTGAGIYYVNIVNPQGATIDIKKIVIQ